MTEGGGGGGIGRPEAPIQERETSGTPERWITPNQAAISSPDGSKAIAINPVFRDVLTKEGQQIGRVMEVALIANPGDIQASLDFKFQRDPQGNYHVLTNGSQSWSSSVAVGKHAELPVVKATDRLVGMRPYEESLGGKTVPFYDPGLKSQKISESEGISYGLVGFRELDTSPEEGGRGGQSKENLVLGEIPSFDGMGGIRYRQEGDSIIVTVTKNLEGVSSKRPITFKVFLSHGRPESRGTASGKPKIVNQYADQVLAFSKELAKLVNIPLMRDRIIGFSWPAYGPAVTQADVQKEIKAGKGMIDTYVIDDGWETDSGSFQVDTKKFPSFADLPRQMKEAGIEHPGIWVAPLKIKGKSAAQLYKLHKEWFMKDEHGKPAKLPIPGEGSLMLDISVPEVREYLADNFLNLAKMGYETFKVDFLAVPFTGSLQIKDKTSVEYYRQTFEDIRQRIRESLGKEIELIGCGAPMMESIGLFNGMRMTGDSALPNLEGWPGIGKVVPLLKRIPSLSRWYSGKNTDMYHDDVAVGGRRALPFNGSFGLIWDGAHIADEGVPLNPDKRDRLNQSIVALNSLGIGNLFVGDSLARIGQHGRQAWRGFINQFKSTRLLSKLQ